jgi:hypothetical protein
VLLLQLPPPLGSSHPLWTRCCAELQQCEPSLPQQRHWGGGGPVGGYRVAAGSCGTIQCAPTKGSLVINGVTEVDFNKKKSNTHWLGRISRGKQLRHIRHGVHVQ